MKNGGQPQAVIKVVPRGGAKNPAQIKRQWDYLSRKGDVEIQRSDHHQAVPLLPEQLADTAEAWAIQTGNWIEGRDNDAQDLTTHIVVSFPHGTDAKNAKDAAREWANDMFGGGHAHDQFDYISMFHTDKDHPHMHFVVNRRGMGGDWLKISKRDPVMNYDYMRDRLVQAANEHGIELEASSRAERGLEDKSLSVTQYRKQVREAVFVYPQREPGVDGDYEDYRQTYGDLPRHVAREFDENGDPVVVAPAVQDDVAGPSNRNAQPDFEPDNQNNDDDHQDSDSDGEPGMVFGAKRRRVSVQRADGAEALPANALRNEADGDQDNQPDNNAVEDANAAGPSRSKRNREEPNVRHPMTLRNAAAKRARTGDTPVEPLAALELAAPDADVDMAAPSTKRAREDITLRSDTSAQETRDDAAALHLRSGKRVKRSGPDGGRSDDHSR